MQANTAAEKQKENSASRGKRELLTAQAVLYAQDKDQFDFCCS
jgi:hypothetical protein